MTPNWRLAAASAVGTSHMATGLPCQDSLAHAVIETLDDTVLVAVVCDGAGSAAHSDVGSWLAAKTFIECIEVFLSDGGELAALNRSVVAGWMAQVRAALEATAKDSGHAARDYACTLLAALAGSTMTAFVQVGDGAIVVSHGEEDGWSYVFWPQHGEYANTTNFVVAPNVEDVMDFELAPRRIDEFAIFSDGIEKLVLHDATRTVHDSFFRNMFPPVRKLGAPGLDAELSKGLERYLSSPVICERTDDDKTLVLASRRPPSEPA